MIWLATHLSEADDVRVHQQPMIEDLPVDIDVDLHACVTSKLWSLLYKRRAVLLCDPASGTTQEVPQR